MEPLKSSPAGKVRIVASRNFPVSKHIAAGLLIIKPGHMREMHWHPNASEWQNWSWSYSQLTRSRMFP
jgi:oxalate decarboxylase